MERDHATELSNDIFSRAGMFTARLLNLLGTWVHLVEPAVAHFTTMAERNEMLLPDGRVARLRRCPRPSFGHDTAVRFAEFIKARALADDHDPAWDGPAWEESPAWEEAVAAFCGEEWHSELLAEGLDVQRWLRETASATHQQVLHAFIVTLNHTRESYYRELALILVPDLPTDSAWSEQLARLFGHAQLDQLRLGNQESADTVRLVANDIKHYGGCAVRSAVCLGVQEGTPIRWTTKDLERYTADLSAFGWNLAKRLASALTGSEPEANESASAWPSCLWLLRFEDVAGRRQIARPNFT